MSAFIIEMGWKSALVLAAALVIASLMRGRLAAERSDVLRGTMLCLPLLPLISALTPLIRIEAPWLAAPQLGEVLVSVAPAPMAGFDWVLVVVALYALGVATLAARTVFGVAQLRRLAGRAEPISAPAWTSVLAASGCNARLLLSDDIAAPLSFGRRQPVILIDRKAFVQPEHAAAIIAHEAAHIVRRDWIVLIAMHAVAALFWINPLVWMVKHAAEQCAEEAADDLAVRHVNGPDYAQALLDCARGARVATAVGMAHRHVLPRRLNLVLAGAPMRERQLWPTIFSGAATLCFSIFVAAVYVVAPVTVASASASVQGTPSPLRAVASTVQIAQPREGPPSIPPSLTVRSLSQQTPVTEPALEEANDLPALADANSPAPTLINATETPPSIVQLTAEDRRRARWSENARRNLERNERREAEHARRDRARANSDWVRMETSSN